MKVALLRAFFSGKYMIAIVRTGGKQYKVAEGMKIKVERLKAEAGSTLELEALFIGDEKDVEVGMPVLKKTVTAKVLSEGRHDKVTGIKFKAKKRQLTRFGHRQPYTELEIVKI
jgi:large subunit ribosomal protein L21